MQMRRFCFVAVTFMAVALTACGGGGSYSNSNSNGPITADVQGTWSGTYSINGESSNVPVIGAIAQDGYGFFYDGNGFMYVLPSLSGSTTLSGTLTGYAPPGATFPNGQKQLQFSVSGTVSSTAITGMFTGDGETGSFSLAPFTPFSGSPSIVAGQWQGYYAGSAGSSYAVDVTMNANGSFSGNDAFGCTITGNISQVMGANLFTITATSAGVGCAGNLTGLGFESSTDSFHLFNGAAGTYFYAGLSNASSAFVSEFKLQ